MALGFECHLAAVFMGRYPDKKRIAARRLVLFERPAAMRVAFEFLVSEAIIMSDTPSADEDKDDDNESTDD